jgi:gluconate 5-dehydrogenase
MAATPDPFHLDGRLALVTGAGSGIGLAIARGLARAGARVVINGRNIAKLEKAAATLLAEDIDVTTLPFDVTDEPTVVASIGSLCKSHGGIDILVNNAAVNQRKPLEEFSLQEWRDLQSANADGPFLVTRAVLGGMKARRHGKVINICSLASDLGRPNIVPYAASKGSLKMLTRALAVEVAPFNVQVNGIAPGFFDTEMNAPLVADAGFTDWVRRRVPAGRWAKPPEIAGAAVFLASPAADFVTGHILYVDGGFAAAY